MTLQAAAPSAAREIFWTKISDEAIDAAITRCPDSSSLPNLFLVRATDVSDRSGRKRQWLDVRNRPEAAPCACTEGAVLWHRREPIN